LKNIMLITCLLITLISNLFFYSVITQYGWDISNLKSFERFIMMGVFLYDITLAPSILCGCYIYIIRKIL